jgi:hypothetical protein
MGASSDLFWYLLLAHFLADYPLQPDWMARNKTQLRVLSLHVAIHFLVMIGLVAPSAILLWPYLLVLAAIHFLIDIGKILVSLRYPQWVSWPYLIDQSFHIITIGLFSVWIGNNLNSIPFPANRALVVYSLGYLMATYVWFISERLLSNKDPHYKRLVIRQAWSRMLVRAGLLTALLLSWNAVSGKAVVMYLPFLATALLPQYTHGLHKRALIIDMSVAVAAALLVIYGT